ncbi:MAG: cupin domain-containing protein [Acidimicrobiia bacterium]
MRLDRGETIRLVDEENGGAQKVDIHVNHLAPDSGPGPRHYHEQAENVYIVLSGMVEVEIEGEVRSLETNDVLFIPPGVIHSTSNPGPDTATFIEVYAPAGRDFHIVDEAEDH